MHTTGEWQFVYEHGQGTGPIIYTVDPINEFNGADICEVLWSNKSTGESLANARLICAAPEMLELLRQTLPELGAHQGLLHRVRSIIERLDGANAQAKALPAPVLYDEDIPF